MLLVLRLTIFAFFAAAVIYVIRHYVRGDTRRMGIAAGWAMVTTLVGAIAIFAGYDMSQEPMAIGQLVFKLASLLPLAGALWVAVYCGQLLGDQQGGYWVKKGARISEIVLWSGAAVLGLLTYNWALCQFQAVAVNLFAPTFPTLSGLFTNLAFSLSEEFFYRGCVQALLVLWLARLPKVQWWAVAIASIVFMVQHVTTPQLMVLPAGIVFGLLFMRFGIWAAVATHFVANLVNEFLLPRLI